jgi:hypothetical protein
MPWLCTELDMIKTLLDDGQRRSCNNRQTPVAKTWSLSFWPVFSSGYESPHLASNNTHRDMDQTNIPALLRVQGSSGYGDPHFRAYIEFHKAILQLFHHIEFIGLCDRKSYRKIKHLLVYLNGD